MTKGKATFTVQGAVKQVYHATQSTTVDSDIDITSKGGHIHLTASGDIVLAAGKGGASTLTLKPDGTKTHFEFELTRSEPDGH